MKTHLPIITLTSLLIMSSQAYGESPYTRAKQKTKAPNQTSSVKVDKKEERSLELNLGLSRVLLDDEEKDGKEDEAVKLSLSGGKVLNITSLFKSTTSLGVQWTETTKVANEGDTRLIADGYYLRDAFLSQKFSYDIDTDYFSITPFVSGSYGIGNLGLEISGNGNTDLKASLDYKKTEYSIGMEFNTNTNLVPYISYTATKYDLDNTGKLEGTLDGSTVNRTVDFQADNPQASAFTLGLNFLF